MAKGVSYSAANVGERIARLREAYGMTQVQFADAIGVARGELASWEAGMRRPSVAKAMGMVKRFGVTLDWLFLDDSRHLSHELAVRLLSRSAEQVPEDRG